MSNSFGLNDDHLMIVRSSKAEFNVRDHDVRKLNELKSANWN